MALKESLLVRGERTSAIAMMSRRGILDVHITSGTTDGDFAQKCIVPVLQPFNSTNPHSVLIMDNCSIHHIDDIADLVEGTGALLHFLPPYSPDLNPIELAFSKVKSELKALESSMATADIDTLLLAAFAAITRDDCQGWISRSGVYN